MLVKDYLQEYRDSPFLEAVEEAGVRSIVAVPLKARGTLIGVLAVDSRVPYAFREEDQQLLERTGRPGLHRDRERQAV